MSDMSKAEDKTSLSMSLARMPRNDRSAALALLRRAQQLDRAGKLAEDLWEIAERLLMLQDDPRALVEAWKK